MTSRLLLGSFAFILACGDSSGSGGSGGGGGDQGGGPLDPGVCPGVDPWPAGTEICRADDDCDASSYCASAPNNNICGGCVPTVQGCETDAECGGGVCEPYDAPGGPCTCEPAMTCFGNCNEAGGCSDGFTCEADGHCIPIACDEGFICAADKTCDTTAGGDAHGCVPLSCDDGFACEGDTVCDSSAAGVDEHGCRPRHCSEGFECGDNQICDDTAAGNGCLSLTCAADADCDCGACLGGICGPRIGACFGYPS